MGHPYCLESQTKNKNKINKRFRIIRFDEIKTLTLMTEKSSKIWQVEYVFR